MLVVYSSGALPVCTTVSSSAQLQLKKVWVHIMNCRSTPGGRPEMLSQPNETMSFKTFPNRPVAYPRSCRAGTKLSSQNAGLSTYDVFWRMHPHEGKS